MKLKALALGLALTLTTPIYAGDYEVFAHYTRIDQELFGTIKFPMEALTGGVGYWTDNTDYGKLGVRLTVGKSTEAVDANAVQGKVYKNTIDSMFSYDILYGYEVLDNSTLFVSIGKTDYRTTWLVNGEEPAWSKDTDSDWSYGVGWNVKLNDYFSYELSYKNIYRKMKEGYGKEKTRGVYSGFTFRF